MAKHPTYPAIKPTNIDGIENFARVSSTLFRGAQPKSHGIAHLKKLGVKTIINLRSFHSDRKILKGSGLRYVHIYCKAWHPKDKDVLKFLKIVQDRRNHPIFVHCQHGADRTGYLLAVYRMIEHGWTKEQAIKELHDFGFHVVWKKVKKYLGRFDAESIKTRLHQAKSPKVKIRI